MKSIYYNANIIKIVVTTFNSFIFLTGVFVPVAIYTAFALFSSLIGVQLHFNVFEDTRDTNRLNQFDMCLSLASLFTLLVLFILRSMGNF